MLRVQVARAVNTAVAGAEAPAIDRTVNGEGQLTLTHLLPSESVISRSASRT